MGINQKSSEKIKVEVFPVVDDAKHWMTSHEDHTLYSVMGIDGPNPLKSSLCWIRDPNFDDVPKLVSIRKTGEFYSCLKGIKGLEEDKGEPVYCATVEIPRNYFEKYRVAIESEKRHKVRQI
jgi:hypothetical protein